MILPGHIAASVLVHRHLRTPLWPTVLAGLAPDLVDKFLCYVLHVAPSSRLPMHTLLGWVGSTLLVGVAAYLIDRSAIRRWLLCWAAGYGGHLLCDSPLAGGKLPFLWPWRTYSTHTEGLPLAYLFHGGPLPVWTLTAELILVLYTLATSPQVRTWLAARRERELAPRAKRPLD